MLSHTCRKRSKHCRIFIKLEQVFSSAKQSWKYSSLGDKWWWPYWNTLHHRSCKTARQNSEIKEDVATEPQPLLIGVANLTRTGCGSYSKLLRKQQELKNHMSDREIRWHRELQCTSGIEFRNRVYSFTASVKYENKIKWLQYQINRNSLFTNYKVNKFRPDISPLCVFYSQVENFPNSSWCPTCCMIVILKLLLIVDDNLHCRS